VLIVLAFQDFLSKVPQHRTADLLQEVLAHTQDMLDAVEEAPLPSEDDTSKLESANVARCVDLLTRTQAARNACHPVDKDRCSMCLDCRRTRKNVSADDRAASSFHLCVPCHKSLQCWLT
jgi:hypothetical protein